MHKGPRPRSMSETGHLPTDVESSDRDPGAAFLLPGTRSFSLSLSLNSALPFPSLSLSSHLPIRLSSPFLFVPSCFWQVGTFQFSASETFVRRSSPYVNRIQYSPPASGRPPSDCVFFRAQKKSASSTKEDLPPQMYLKFLIANFDVMSFSFFGSFFKTEEKYFENKVIMCRKN